MSQPKKTRVLLVEDDDAIRGLLELQFVVLRYSEFFGARDGEEGLHLAKSFSPDVIVTDLHMPRMSGLEMIRAIRALEDEKLRSTPIIVVTGDTSSVHLECLEAGANFVLEKPIRCRRLMDAVQSVLAS